MPPLRPILSTPISGIPVYKNMLFLTGCSEGNQQFKALKFLKKYKPGLGLGMK